MTVSPAFTERSSSTPAMQQTTPHLCQYRNSHALPLDLKYQQPLPPWNIFITSKWQQMCYYLHNHYQRYYELIISSDKAFFLEGHAEKYLGGYLMITGYNKLCSLTHVCSGCLQFCLSTGDPLTDPSGFISRNSPCNLFSKMNKNTVNAITSSH